MTDMLETIGTKPVTLDTLSIIVSFLDWICDLETFEVISKVLNLSTNEKDKILAYWKSKTKFEEISFHKMSISGFGNWDSHLKHYYTRKVNGKLHNTDGGPALKDSDRHCWYQNGKLHREDGPAVVWYRGGKEWWQNGQRHRVGAPAAEFGENREWWQNGKKHRLDGPAIERFDGKQYWQNGLLHRLNGPALIHEKNTKQWHLNGKLHRLDGPAVEYDNGKVLWYIDGIQITDLETIAKLKMKLKK